jgi:hypothetical protein
MEGLVALNQFLSIVDVMFSLVAAVVAARLFGLGWDIGAITIAFLAAWLLKPVVMAGLLALAMTSGDQDTALALLIAVPIVSGVASRLALALIGCLLWTSLRRA